MKEKHKLASKWWALWIGSFKLGDFNWMCTMP